MLRKYSRFLPLAALLFGLAACDDGTTGPGLRAGDGGFTLLLTDAPGDFHAAVVTISEIRLHGEGGGDVALIDEPYTVDLLELRNEVATIVQGFDVPPGDYRELRLIIEGAYIEVETDNGGTKIYASSPDYHGLPTGVVADGILHMPSMGQSGLKVKLPGTVDVNEDDTIVMIDFDVEESFGHQAGRSGRWIMHPVIRASDVTYGGNLVARLQLGDGVVLPELAGTLVSLADFEVYLTPAGGGTARDGELTDADSDGIYEFMFKGLVPGSYELDFAGPAGLLVSFAPLLPLTVDVLERQTVTETVTLSSAMVAASLTATLTLGNEVTLPTIGENVVTLADFDAELTPDGGDPITVSFTDANTDGTFEATFGDLSAGEYSLTILAPSGVSATYDVSLPVDVTLAEGEAQTQAIVVTDASEG